jgi:CRISPR-associated endonuclease/helicase Cas3
MQQEALITSLPDGPCLTIIEDMTGAGKTEAALILTARMMAAGKGAGLFFALPTMATANAMLGRLESAAPSLFDRAPTLALTHGRSRYSTAFRMIQARDPGHPEHVPYCGQWLAEDRRRVLLADVGVGTIDQALLAVLPTRFNALRLRALSKHILIVDEAHSYDPYMQAQLERLLTMQARLGGAGVVLTATLPARMKHAFETAFQAGLRDRPKAGRRKAVAARVIPGPYPALTVVSHEVRLKAVNAASARSVAVVRLSDPAEAVSLIVAGAAKGAACIWIRNAVDDAISAVQALAEHGIAADLLHARFALCDRLRHEVALQGRFGRDGTDRSGRVLVATQVAEQSLDLDFDVMVSDLAPIGSLIQRAGRMWRHMDLRPTRPVPAPILHVLSPDPAKVSERWLHGVLEKGAYVYPPVEQWRSAKVLFDTGALNTPEGLRHLIEAVHGDLAPDPPEALEKAGFAYEGEALIMRQMARNSVIDPFAAFDQEQMQKVWDDEAFPTRLGVPQRVLALARKTLDGLVPYGDDWVMSELQLSAVRVNKLVLPDQMDPQIRAVKQKWSKGRAEHTLIVPLADDGFICEGLRYDPNLGAIWC